MDEEHPYERVELRRTGRNRNWHSRSGEAARLKRLSWSISDLHQLPGSSKSLTSKRHERLRNASISSCSLSSGSSNLSLKSNGSFRRKARIPVSGFTERAFLANERSMVEQPEIIVKEDMEHLAREEVEVAMENENNQRHINGESGDQHSNDWIDCQNKKTTFEPSLSLVKSENANPPLFDQSSLSKSVKQTPSSKQSDGSKSRERGMSVSSLATRDSLSSISSFSSSFMIDRIFHWRKSSTKSPDSDTIKNFRMSESERGPHSRLSSVSHSAADQHYEQIDQLAAESLATFTSVTGDRVTIASSQPVPEKPVRWHIRQLELVLGGVIRPPSLEDPGSVRLRLDSLRVLESLDSLGLLSPSSDGDLYDVPRCL